MSHTSPPSPILDADYEALETALNQSARGRWFLDEYVRRHQPAEYAMLRDALQKLERAMAAPSTGPTRDLLARDLIEMSETIARTKREVSALSPFGDGPAAAKDTGVEISAMIEDAKRTTTDILGAAEAIQEMSWQLRDKGAEDAFSDRIDKRTRDIYASCSLQEIAAQRLEKIVDVMGYLESRVSEMMKVWGLEPIETDLDLPADVGAGQNETATAYAGDEEGTRTGVDLMSEAAAMDRDLDDIGPAGLKTSANEAAASGKEGAPLTVEGLDETKANALFS